MSNRITAVDAQRAFERLVVEYARHGRDLTGYRLTIGSKTYGRGSYIAKVDPETYGLSDVTYLGAQTPAETHAVLDAMFRALCILD